jgi:succinate dehydrogenase / fumarate reductase cytochrome b subunit
MSISHRITGVFLVTGTLALIYWLMAVAMGPETYQQAQQILGSPIGLLLLFAWSFSLFYHLCSGIRHLFWDAGYGFELKTIYASGYLVWVATCVLTGLAWGFALMNNGGM